MTGSGFDPPPPPAAPPYPVEKSSAPPPPRAAYILVSKGTLQYVLLGFFSGVNFYFSIILSFSCFIAMWPRIGGLLIPIAFILAINLVIFVRVLHRLSRRVEGRSLVGKTERRQRLRRCQNAVTILVLMGLTWVVGYLSIIRPASVFVQGIFTILNSLQGYFIFMLYCVRQPLVRRIWRSQFFCCVPPTKRESPLKPSSKSTSGNTDSSDAAIVRRQKSNHGFNSFSQDMQGGWVQTRDDRGLST